MTRISIGLLAQWLFHSFLQAASEPQKTGHGNIGLPELLVIAVVAGLLVALVAGIIVVMKNAGGSGKKRCPYCAETIQAEAQICRFCNRPVTYGNQI